MPTPCDSALDVGCGDGVLTAKLSEGSARVTGIDISSEMIAFARETSSRPNVVYVEGDFLVYPLPAEGFDFIVVVAAMHHMPLEAALGRLTSLLRRGGVLAVVGLARNGSLFDYAFSAVSIPLSRLVRIRKGWWQSPVRRVDPDETFVEIRQVARRMLPGVKMRRRLFFRYTLEWRKP